MEICVPECEIKQGHSIEQKIPPNHDLVTLRLYFKGGYACLEVCFNLI